MSERFFVEPPISGDTASIIGQEASHLAKVLRAKVGTEVTLFDASGWEFKARIAAIDRHTIRCEILDRAEVDREANRQVIIATALPKGDRQRFLIEKLTELGVARLIPIIAARSVVQPDESAVDRLGRFVIEASKQCGRNRLMEIAPPIPLQQLLQQTDHTATRLIAHPGSAIDTMQAGREISDSGKVYVCVGPEGGFTEDEVAQALAAGWKTISFGPRILRIETAAIAFAARLAE